MEDLKQLQEILVELQSTNIKAKKENIIKNNLDNDLFVKTMLFLLDDMIVTGVSYKRLITPVETSYILPSQPYTLIELIKYLKENNTGRDKDVYVIQDCAWIGIDGTCDPDEFKDFIYKIASKSLKLGLSASTWNKSVPKELKIAKFDVMLAKSYKDYKEKVKGKWFTITKKLDGNRIVAIKENGIVKFYTRKGKPYFGLDQIEKSLTDISYDNFVLDGELLSSDSDKDTLELFRETSSKAGQARTKGKTHTGLDFHAFDLIPIDEFRKGKSTNKTLHRKADLHWLFENNNIPHCKEVKVLYQGTDIAKIDKWFKYSQAQGWEGIMINLDSPYVTKRTDQILKLKAVETCDIRIIGFEAGKIGGKLENTLGKLIVSYKGFSCGCGGGFSEKQRDLIWNNQDKYLETIVEIEYTGESTNSKNDDLNMRFARFKKFRPDKTEESYN